MTVFLVLYFTTLLLHHSPMAGSIKLQITTMNSATTLQSVLVMGTAVLLNALNPQNLLIKMMCSKDMFTKLFSDCSGCSKP